MKAQILFIELLKLLVNSLIFSILFIFTKKKEKKIKLDRSKMEANYCSFSLCVLLNDSHLIDSRWI